MDKNPNFQLLMENEIKNLTETPRLLLHSCCGPCSSAVMEVLTRHFDLTVFYYNPSIYPPEEFEKRLGEQRRLIESMPFEHSVSIAVPEYDHSEFLRRVHGLEDVPEGGARCCVCFRQRLEAAARYAYENGFGYFTTTLSVSPHKNSYVLNTIGSEAAERWGVKYLYSDFKKKGGFNRSTQLSQEYNLYRQVYCGCEFSKGYPF